MSGKHIIAKCNKKRRALKREDKQFLRIESDEEVAKRLGIDWDPNAGNINVPSDFMFSSLETVRACSYTACLPQKEKGELPQTRQEILADHPTLSMQQILQYEHILREGGYEIIVGQNQSGEDLLTCPFEVTL